MYNWEGVLKVIDSYKNIERLRYRIHNDLVMLGEEIKNNTNEQNSIFIEECFSAIASTIAALFLAEGTFDPLKNLLLAIGKKILGHSIPEVVISIVAMVLCMLFLLLLSVQINKILLKLKKKKRVKRIEGHDTTDYVKEFDNIACDSIFVSLEYRYAYEDSDKPNEKILFFIEVVHYLETAVDKTVKLCENSNNLRTSQNVKGVDVFRVHSIKTVMLDLCVFLNQEINKISMESYDKAALQKRIEKINVRINSINV